MTNKNIRKTSNPFLTKKGGIDNFDIMLIDNETMITDEQESSQCFNEHYMNIVECSSGIKPENLSCHPSPQGSQDTTNKVIKSYKNHPSIAKIRSNVKTSASATFDFDFNHPLTLVSQGEVE